MKGPIALIFLLGTLWDAATTVFGTATIITGQENPDLFNLDEPELISAVVFALIVTGILAGASTVFVRFRQSSFFLFGIGLVIFLFALFYDVYTSYIGNVAMVIKDQPTGDQLLLTIALTLFSSASPLILSFLYRSDI